MNNEKLKIDLCSRLPYGVKLKFVSKYKSDRLSVQDIVTLKEINEGSIYVNGYKTNNKSYVPLLFPISSLCKEIQLADYNNGEPFVPIVEILKIEHKNWYEEKLGTRYAEIEYKETPNSAKAWFSFMATKDTNLYTLMPWSFPLWIIDLLNRWKIDYRGLINEGLAIEVNSDNNPYL